MESRRFSDMAAQSLKASNLKIVGSSVQMGFDQASGADPCLQAWGKPRVSCCKDV